MLKEKNIGEGKNVVGKPLRDIKNRFFSHLKMLTLHYKMHWGLQGGNKPKYAIWDKCRRDIFT